jgi:Transglycosylase SLT domain
MLDNTILTTFVAAGASARTARQDNLPSGGRQASHIMAETDLGRVRLLITKFNVAGSKTDLPPALLAAIASRESRCGNVLDRNGFGDAENAFGIMQVDKRSHNLEGLPDPHSQEHIDQAAAILNEAFQQARRRFEGQPLARQLQAAVAGYNCGVGKVQSPADADTHTTGQDYSNDVWTRAQFYAERWPATAGNGPTG